MAESFHPDIAIPNLPVVRLKQFDIRNRINPYTYVWADDLFVVIGRIGGKALLMQLDEKRTIHQEFYDLDRFEIAPPELYLHLL